MKYKNIDIQLVIKTYCELGKVAPTVAKLHIGERTIRNILKENNVAMTPRCERNRKYKVDDNFFESIDTQEKAYVLGFVCADGHINKGSLCIELSAADEEILLKIRDVMGSDQPLYHRTRRRKETYTYSSTLVISRQKIVNDLIKLGINFNKTWDLKLPITDDNLFRHFLRGLNDGDGSIIIDNKNRVLWSLISTIDMSNGIIEKLNQLGFTPRQRIKYNYSKPLAITIITAKDEAIRLRDFLYKDSNIFLNRKFIVFNNIYYKDVNFSGVHNPFYGKRHSLETKEKLRFANCGEKCGAAKLTINDVIFIKKSGGIKTKQLAEQFNVGPEAIRAIRRGDTWSHIMVDND